MADLLITNANVATLQGPPGPRAGETDVALIEGGAVAVEGGRIAWVGQADAFDGEAGETVDAGGMLVTPGYVDGHNHLVYAGDRAFELGMKLAGKSYMEILAAGGGIAHTTQATRAATVDELTAQTAPRLKRMMRAGTTSVEAKTGYALETKGELRMLEAGRRLESHGARMVHTFLGAHAVPGEFKDDAAGYVDLVLDEMLPAVADQGIATFCDVFVEEGAFTPEQGRAILERAAALGLQTRIHADEIVNTGGAQLAADVGAVSADHLLTISDAGIDAMAQAGTIATMMPTVPITMMKPKWPPVKRMVQAGIPIALGTDHNPNNPVTSMALVQQLSCFLLGLTPDQALTGATWNAACSLGIEGEVGSIEVGKRADLILHDVSDIEHLVYEPGRDTAAAVWCQGRRI